MGYRKSSGTKVRKVVFRGGKKKIVKRKKLGTGTKDPARVRAGKLAARKSRSKRAVAVRKRRKTLMKRRGAGFKR